MLIFQLLEYMELHRLFEDIEAKEWEISDRQIDFETGSSNVDAIILLFRLQIGCSGVKLELTQKTTGLRSSSTIKLKLFYIQLSIMYYYTSNTVFLFWVYNAIIMKRASGSKQYYFYIFLFVKLEAQIDDCYFETTSPLKSI